MSEEQLSALLAKLKEDAGLREKLQGVGDLDAVIAMAKEAGFDVSKADWLRHQAQQTLALSDKELEGVAGGHDGPCEGGAFSGAGNLTANITNVRDSGGGGCGC